MDRFRDSPEAGDISDDSISVNSTLPSEPEEQYIIDGGILAERQNDGVTQYLVKWEGYDEHRNTWEPEGNFQSGDTIKEWGEKKMRITRGLDKPFNVNAFEERKQKIMEDIAWRKRRRRLKRKRLRLPIDSSSSSSNAGSSNSEVLTSDSDAPLVNSVAKRKATTEDESVPSHRQSQRLLRRPWTDQERRALEAGCLRVKGPLCDRILSLYGPEGTINQDLKYMNEHDLQKEAFRMKMEFVELQRSPPFWLEPVTSRKLQITRPNPPSKMTASNVSTHKTQTPTPTAEDDPSLKSIRTGSLTARTVSITPEVVKPKKYKGTARSEPPTRQESLGVLGQSPTAHPTRKVPGQASVQMGVRGVGPAPREKYPKIKAIIAPQTSKESPKDAKNRSKLMAPQGASDKVVGSEPPKLFKNLATLNRVSKRSLNEPSPDLDSLVFIDPRTGKAPRLASAPSPGASPTKSVLDNATGRKSTPLDKPLAEGHENGQQRRDNPPVIPMRAHSENENPSKARPRADKIARMNDIQGVDGPNTTKVNETTQSQNPKDQGGNSSSAPTGPSLLRRRDRTALQPGSCDVRLLRESSRASKMDLFQQRVDPSTSYHVVGNLIVGIHNPDSYQVRLQGFDKNLQQRLLTVKVPPNTVHFNVGKTCLAAEYRQFFPMKPSEFLGWGIVVPSPNSQDGIDSLAFKLAYSLSGALCFARLFTMIIYPVGADAWAFLDRDLPATPDGAMLRFVVRQPLSAEFAESKASDLASSWLQNPSPDDERLVANASNATTDYVTKGVSTAFQKLFSIDYNRLVSNKQPVFFLVFIPAGCERYEKDPGKRHSLRLRTSEEHDLFVEFLQAHGAEVYSMQNLGSYEPNTNGSWDYFVNNVKSGVIVIHDGCTRIDLIPNLANFITMWQIDVFKFSLEPLDEDAQSPHLIRLFPHGAVLLLTESLICYRPREALRILMWFRLIKNHRERVPGTWKLAVRVHIRPWLLDILDLYEETKTDVFGCGKQVFGDIYTNITWLLEENYDPDGTDTYIIPDGMMCYEWDDETPNEEAPLVAPGQNLHEMKSRTAWNIDGSGVEIDHESIRLNDDLLVQWFAEWATVACEHFRRFHIVLGHEPGDTFEEIARPYRKRWGHIDAVLTAEKCFKRHGITAQADLDVKEAARLCHKRKHAPKLYEKIERGRKKEREAAKISLERIKAMYHDAGATEKQIRDGARIYLQQTGATLKEIKEVEIDMDLRNSRNQSPKRGLANDINRIDEIEAMLAEEKLEDERAEREDKERLAQGRDKVMDWIVRDEGGEEDVEADPALMLDGTGAADEDRGEAREDAVARSIRLAKEFPL